MTKAELLNIIKGYFITWNCGGEYNDKGFDYYSNEASAYDKGFVTLLAWELPEDWDNDRERWENYDYSDILETWERDKDKIKAFVKLHYEN